MVLLYYSSLGEEPSRIHSANWLPPERLRARPRVELKTPASLVSQDKGARDTYVQGEEGGPLAWVRLKPWGIRADGEKQQPYGAQSSGGCLRAPQGKDLALRKHFIFAW